MATNNIINQAGPRPMFFAYLSNGAVAANITGDNTVATITFDSVGYDTTSSFNLTNGIYTAPTTGRYQVNVNVMLYPITSTYTSVSGIIHVTLKRTYAFAYWNPSSMCFLSQYLAIGTSQIVDLVAGDTMYVTTQVGNNAKTVGFWTGGTGDPQTMFSAFLIE